MKTATERGSESGDVQDSSLQISRFQEPQPRVLGGFNRIHGLHGRFCNPKCPCTCHRWRLFQSPTILKGVAGSLLIVHNIMFLSRRRCDDAYCFGRREKQVADINYIFPKWICNRTITLSLTTSSIYGLEFTIRVAKMNPNTMSLYRTATVPGGLDHVKELLEEREISPYDVDENGDTMLHVRRISVYFKI